MVAGAGIGASKVGAGVAVVAEDGLGGVPLVRGGPVAREHHKPVNFWLHGHVADCYGESYLSLSMMGDQCKFTCILLLDNTHLDTL